MGMVLSRVFKDVKDDFSYCESQKHPVLVQIRGNKCPSPATLLIKCGKENEKLIAEKENTTW